MRKAVGWLIGVLVLLVVVAATAEWSSRSSACMTCHRQEANFSEWMKHRLASEKKGFSHELIGCADCHIAGAPAGTMMSKGRSLLHLVTYLVPQIDPRSTQVSRLFNETRIPSENCQYCHQAAMYRKEVWPKDLPAGLAEIGLVMDHRKHVLAKDDTCATCHERYKDNAAQANKAVNYMEVNHLACDSCHSSAAHSYRGNERVLMSKAQYQAARQAAWQKLSTNPRWMVSMPTELSCRRCHNGQIHYKTKIFLADCREGKDYDNCLKCHPAMSRDYFERYLKKRGKAVTASLSTVGSP
jgi:nitrate/TMAO reductase-like tetraheme cytochrome c subunit